MAVFEPDAEEKGLQISPATYTDDKQTEGYVVIKLNEVAKVSAQEAAQLFVKAKNHFAQLSSRIQFNTPDPYINTLVPSCWLLMATGTD